MPITEPLRVAGQHRAQSSVFNPLNMADMIKVFHLLSMISLAVILIGCGDSTTKPISPVAPLTMLDQGPLFATAETDRGTFRFKLRPDRAPISCANFVNLVQRGYLKIFRSIDTRGSSDRSEIPSTTRTSGTTLAIRSHRSSPRISSLTEAAWWPWFDSGTIRPRW